MTPDQISYLLIEDIGSNNGLIFEADQTIEGILTPEQLYGADQYPYIGKNVALPTYELRTNVNKDTLYDTIKGIAKQQNGIHYTGIIGARYQGGVFPLDVIKSRIDPENYALLQTERLHIVHTINNFSIGDVISLARKRRGKTAKTGFSPEDWAHALKSLIPAQNIITKMPEIFTDYVGATNPEMGYVMLVSGTYGDGLYLVPQTIELNGAPMNWDDACNTFAENPEQYVDVGEQYARIAERTRLLFRKYLEESGQGQYIHRFILSPQDTVELFGAAKSLDEFMTNYRVKGDAVERLEALIESNN